MYTVVIDESGDTGLENVAADPSRGPSQYFTMCAALYRNENSSIIEEKLNSLPFSGQRSLHAKHLNHYEKVVTCQAIAELPVGLLGVISNKLSLQEYLPEANRTPTHYYNKVMQYLLERVGAATGALGITSNELRVVLEARKQQYSSLLSFIAKIQSNPLDTRATLLRNIDRFSITAVKKKDEPCIRVADMGAHALFCTVRRDERVHSIVEPRYLRELAPVFLAGQDGRLVPRGLKPIHSIMDLAAPLETSSTLAILRNPNNGYHRIML